MFDGEGKRSDVTALTAPGHVTLQCAAGEKGDVNQDGKIGIGDVVLILRIALFTPPSLTACLRASADVNCDGAIDLGDAIRVLQKYVLGTPFPCQ